MEGSENLIKFLTALNSSNYNPKFTHVYDAHTISFLDLEIKNREGEIITNLYRKPSAGNTFLRFKLTSCSPS